MSDTITVFKGDGIGPEITDAVLKILDAAGAGLTYEIFSVGEAEYEAHGELIPAEGFASFDKNKVLLKIRPLRQHPPRKIKQRRKDAI